MRKKGTSKARFLAWMLCVLMLFSLLPPRSVQAGSTDADDATLNDLVCNWGARKITMNVVPLVPEFNETDREYTAALVSNTGYFYVWPETTNPDATFVIEGISGASNIEYKGEDAGGSGRRAYVVYFSGSDTAEISITVTAADGQTQEVYYVTLMRNTALPVITFGDTPYERLDKDSADITFSTTTGGSLYYLVQSAEEAAPTTLDTSGEGLAVEAGENTVKVQGLLEEKSSVYMAVKDSTTGLTGKIARVDLPVYQSPDDPKQPVPDASFDAASMLLTNVDAAMIYSVDGGKSWNAISGDTVDLSQDTVTAEHGIQVKKLKDEIKTEDSDPQILVLTQKEQVSAPVLEYSAADSAAVTTIKGQEYAIKAKDDEKFGQWQTSGEFTGLTEGTEYEIVTRVSGSGLALASEPSIPVTFKAENVFEEIGTASELLAFAKKIDSGSTKACARLTKNIDMSGATWKQVATDEDKPYQGTIDGNGFAIKNITFGNNEMNDTGLFQYTKGATFKNLTVNMTVAGKIRTGGLVEYAVNNLFEDCHISGTVTSYYSNAGAYASYDESSTFRNCTNSAAVTLKQGSGNTGGFIGTASGTVMENCVNKGKVSCAIGNGAGFIGTVGGRMIGGKMQPYTGVKLTNCYNEAVITANETIGMPSGIAGGISSESEITNCYNTGHIIGGEKRAAGIVGSISESVIRGCYNTGIVEGAAETGGIVANAAFESQIIDSYNQGEILGSGKYIGGIAGNTETYTGYEGAKIIECYNEGKITGRTGSSFIGGLVGFSQSMSMERSYNKGEIAGPSDASGDLFVGGLVGQAAKSSIEDSYNTGGINCSGNCGGGIAGFLYNGTTIVGCYNTGIVNGNSYTGGIAGYSKTNNTISRCYNLAKVAATGKYVGGIAGYLTADGSITDSYNAGDTFSLALSGNDYAAGILGYLTLGTLDNNYFLETEEVNQGIEAVGGSAGGVDTVTNTSSKTAEEFQNGTVTRLLNTKAGTQESSNVWGQGYPQNAELASLPLFMEQAVATGKEQAGLELDSYKNLEDYREAQQKELAEAIAGGKAAIQAADTVEGIQTALAEAKTAMDAIKTDAQLTQEELEAAKAEAEKALSEYKNASDYREAQQKELAEAIENGKKAIDSAKDKDAVEAALKAAKKAMDVIKTDAQLTQEELEGAKAEAEKALSEYKNASDYREAQQKELAEAIENGKKAIDSAKDKDAVEAALKAAKKAMDVIKTDAQLTKEELEGAKAEAEKALSEYKNAADYREAQQKELAEAIENGKKAIDSAKDKDAVEAALKAAKKAIDVIKTDAQLTQEELEGAKAEAEKALSEYKNASDYREAQQKELAEAIENGKKAIDSAKDKAAVEAALKAAKKAMDAVKTDVQMTEEETVRGVALDRTSVVLDRKGTITLKASVSPDTALNQKVNWSSSNTKVASVDQKGKVTAGEEGTAVITVTTEDGKKTASCSITVTYTGGWKQNSRGWWYRYSDGTWPADCRIKIGTYYYAFDADGYMKTGWAYIGGRWSYHRTDGGALTGWQKIGNTWYYLNTNSIMATGWLKQGNTWYYLNGSGAMQTGWYKVGSTWYYSSSSGAMQTGWQKIGGTWYYLKSSGAMATGWLKQGNTWYYLNVSGAMQTGWYKVGSTWYYSSSSGAMQTGWQKIGGTWYYLKSSGAMATGWIQLGGKWYYLYSNGAMASNTWVGKYYVNGSGVWTKTR